LNAKWAGKAVRAGWTLGQGGRKEKKEPVMNWAKFIFGPKGFGLQNYFSNLNQCFEFKNQMF
jgi:hypothetical protein